MSWLSERLGELVSQRGIAFAKMARDLAIERSQLTQIMAGSRTPNEILTRRLAAYLGEDADAWVRNTIAPDTATPVPDAQSFSSGFVAVATVSEVPPGEMLMVLDGRAVVANIDGDLLAFANVCPHAGASLGEGFVDDYVVECPWHGGRWDVRTGEALTLLATADIDRFEVRVSSDQIEVDLG